VGRPETGGPHAPLVPFADWAQRRLQLWVEPLPRPALLPAALADGSGLVTTLAGCAGIIQQIRLGAGPRRRSSDGAAGIPARTRPQLAGSGCTISTQADRRRSMPARRGDRPLPAPHRAVRTSTVNSPAAEYFEASTMCPLSGMSAGAAPSADYASRIPPGPGTQLALACCLADWNSQKFSAVSRP